MESAESSLHEAYFLFRNFTDFLTRDGEGETMSENNITIISIHASR